MEVDGGHEIVRQPHDEATHQGRDPPFIHVTAENAKCEVGIAANGDHDEPDATEDGTHRGEEGEVEGAGVGGGLA